MSEMALVRRVRLSRRDAVRFPVDGPHAVLGPPFGQVEEDDAIETAVAKQRALLDAQLTARVYLELVGGRQTRLKLAPLDIPGRIAASEIVVPRLRPEPLPPRINAEQAAIHATFIAAELGDEAIWNWS